MNHVAVVGVGLIGGSVGMALRARGLARKVVGVGRDAARLDEAVRLGAIDEGTTDYRRGVDGADVAVVCTPVTRVVEDVIRLAEAGGDGLLVTDAGSTKARIVAGVEDHPRARLAFVGAHPIAGSERQGAAHGRADLFKGRACVLTPTERTPPDRLERARAFWSSIGGRVFEMRPAAHDDALALTSHLPHAVAAALAAAVPAELLPFAAGAYRDGTRVAAADASLWAGIFLENRRPVLDALSAFEAQLQAFREALAAGDGPSIRRWWEVANERRGQFLGAAPGGASEFKDLST